MFYLIFILGLICSVINDKRKIIFIFFSSALAILAYLRYGIGADFFAYQYLYSRLSDSLITELYYGLDNQELGFRLIGSFFKSLNVPYQGYISIIASINLFFVFKTCKNFSKNPTLSMLLYFCFYYLVWTFSGLRQGLTLSIGIYYLLKYINNRKIIKFTSIIILLSF
ncbi:EpsG family protein, partial [Paenibacillus sp. GCM10012307]